jgi:hypothetical protein
MGKTNSNTCRHHQKAKSPHSQTRHGDVVQVAFELANLSIAVCAKQQQQQQQQQQQHINT